MRKALATLPGVRQVHVDFAKKEAVVSMQADKYDPKELVKALEEAGFGATILNDSQAQPDDSAKVVPPVKKIDPAHQIVFQVEGFT